MKFIVGGNGGRESAIVEALAKSLEVTEIICCVGNPGIAATRLRKNGELVECIPIPAGSIRELLAFACERFPTLAERAEVTLIVGSEDLLAAGITDMFLAKGFKVYGPKLKAAELEISKVFSQGFMEKYDIPHARGGVFTDVQGALGFVTGELGGRGVVKWPYPVKGKGVFPCEDVAQAKTMLEKLLIEGIFPTPKGRATEVVVQEFLEGPEMSLQAVFAGDSYVPFEGSQDHKRALEGDNGGMTGGMGAFSPTPFFRTASSWGSGLIELQKQVFDGILRGCVMEGLDFCGTVFPGIILTEKGGKVLEINARWPDPETQPTLARLQTDFALIVDAAVNRRLNTLQPLHWDPRHAATVVLASGGYPDPYQTGKVITGLAAADNIPGAVIHHAGTKQFGNEIRTDGGRVLGVTVIRPSLQEAVSVANGIAEQIQFEGKHFRRDIGSKALAHYSD